MGFVLGKKVILVKDASRIHLCIELYKDTNCTNNEDPIP